MSDFIKVDTAQVASTAGTISRLNGELYTLLADSQTAVKGLSATWSGKGADDTRAAYDAFAQKYFEDYRKILDEYVKFLNSHVDAGYVATETNVESLAEQFK